MRLSLARQITRPGTAQPAPDPLRPAARRRPTLSAFAMALVLVTVTLVVAGPTPAYARQCLMLDHHTTIGNGRPIIQYPYCDAGHPWSVWSTQWVYHAPCTGNCFGFWYALIKNRATGKCLDAASSTGRPVQQAVLQQWDCITSTTQWNAWNQMWEIYDPTPVVVR